MCKDADVLNLCSAADTEPCNFDKCNLTFRVLATDVSNVFLLLNVLLNVFLLLNFKPFSPKKIRWLKPSWKKGH